MSSLDALIVGRAPPSRDFCIYYKALAGVGALLFVVVAVSILYVLLAFPRGPAFSLLLAPHLVSAGLMWFVAYLLYWMCSGSLPPAKSA